MAHGCPLRILALSGSLRARSTNTALLEAAVLLAPQTVTVTLYAGLGTLPLFDPDLDDGERPLPPAVQALRHAVASSDALLIACPEYAHGVPGAFKNSLDWLVGGAEFPGKPVALFLATTRGVHMRASLEEILTTMSGRLLSAASLVVPLVGRPVTAADLVSDPATAADLTRALRALAAELTEERHEQI